MNCISVYFPNELRYATNEMNYVLDIAKFLNGIGFDTQLLFVLLLCLFIRSIVVVFCSDNMCTCVFLYDTNSTKNILVETNR